MNNIKRKWKSWRNRIFSALHFCMRVRTKCLWLSAIWAVLRCLLCFFFHALTQHNAVVKLKKIFELWKNTSYIEIRTQQCSNDFAAVGNKKQEQNWLQQFYMLTAHSAGVKSIFVCLGLSVLIDAIMPFSRCRLFSSYNRHLNMNCLPTRDKKALLACLLAQLPLSLSVLFSRGWFWFYFSLSHIFLHLISFSFIN